MSLPVGQASARWALAEGAPDALGGGGHRHIGDAARGEGVEEARGVEYVYEQPLTIREGRVRYPDFTIADHARGVTFYWEHLGMLDDPSYQTRWERKRAEYFAAGIRSHEEGGGPEGTLIETRDDPRGGLDAAAIAELIDKVLLG